MGYNLKEACKGCPECVQCRLAGETYKVFYCDSCRMIVDASELRRYKGEDICLECFLDVMAEEWGRLPDVQEG